MRCEYGPEIRSGLTENAIVSLESDDSISQIRRYASSIRVRGDLFLFGYVPSVVMVALALHSIREYKLHVELYMAFFNAIQIQES